MYNNQFYVIQGWMVNELKLKGNELICYAVIYGCCQDQQSVFKGTASYIAECVGCTRECATRILKNLTDNNFIIKINQENTNIPAYSINWNKIQNTPEKPVSDVPVQQSTENETLKNQEIVSKWNIVAKKHKIAEIRSLTLERVKKIKLRLKEQNMTLDQFFEEIDIALSDSPFLRGKKWHDIPGHPNDSYWEDADWRADFDFFLQPSSFQKAIEGKYANPLIRKERLKKQGN